MIDMQFKIFRFDPESDEEPYFRNYKVKAEPWERLLDCINRIKWEQDGTLNYRMSCAHGVCGSDAMKINGRCALACQKLVKDYQDAEVVLEPLPTFKVLKDLVVDLEPFFERVDLVRPYLIGSDAPEKERLQSPEDRKKVDAVIRCILCACCVGACPVSQREPGFHRACSTRASIPSHIRFSRRRPSGAAQTIGLRQWRVGLRESFRVHPSLSKRDSCHQVHQFDKERNREVAVRSIPASRNRVRRATCAQSG